jgi:hypothetical protein
MKEDEIIKRWIFLNNQLIELKRKENRELWEKLKAVKK